MKVIRIIDRSAGNESVGEMWQETEIFDDSQPISDLFKTRFHGEFNKYIHLSIPESELQKEKKDLPF